MHCPYGTYIVYRKRLVLISQCDESGQFNLYEEMAKDALLWFAYMYFNIYDQRRELFFSYSCRGRPENLSLGMSLTCLTSSFLWEIFFEAGKKQNNLFMRKILFLVACLCLISSCSNDNEDTDNGGGKIKTDKLSKATIQKAKYIYGTSDKNTKGLKSTSNENNFWMVDNNGNVEAIRFITESGVVKNMNIENVFEVNDKYIIMEGYFQIKFVNESDWDKNDDLPLDFFAKFILVNKETGALYKFPFQLNTHPTINNDSPQFYTDSNGDFYFSDDKMVYRARVSENGDIEVEKYIPENQEPRSFIVNTNGICVINPNDPQNCKFKLNNGRMYSIEHFIEGNEANIFVGFNNNFYVAYPLDNKLQISEFVENNGELNCKEITKADISIHPQIQFVQNHVRENHIAINGNTLIEFWEGYPGQNISEQPLVNLPDISQPNLYINDNYLYIRDGYSKIIKYLGQVSLNTNESKLLDFFKSGYEAYSISISKNSSDISFSGLRYSDGKNIIGIVDGNGTFTINESTKTESQITTLIRLN